jgi:hypothetical protein
MVAEPLVGSNQAEQDAQGRGLARAVGSEEARDPPGAHREAEVTDGGDSPEPLGEFLADYWFHGLSVTKGASRVVVQAD